MIMTNYSGDATTTICHRYTPPDQLRVFTKTADILVVATGIPGLITADMVKPGAAIIDIGINRVKDKVTGKYKLVGDVDFEGKNKHKIHLKGNNSNARDRHHRFLSRGCLLNILLSTMCHYLVY